MLGNIATSFANKYLGNIDTLVTFAKFNRPWAFTLNLHL